MRRAFLAFFALAALGCNQPMPEPHVYASTTVAGRGIEEIKVHPSDVQFTVYAHWLDDEPICRVKDGKVWFKPGTHPEDVILIMKDSMEKLARDHRQQINEMREIIDAFEAARPKTPPGGGGGRS